MNQEKKEERKKNIAEFWKRTLFHNFSIKILSIIGAGIVWLLIMNIDDPYKTKNFVVQVETTNEEALRSVNKVYEIVEGSTANVSVRGKRSVVDNLEAGDISATADLSELSSVNAVAIKVRLKKNVSSDVVLECNQVLKVSLEDMETKQVKVTVDTEGTPAEGYSVGECIARPNVIEVTGGSSVIDRITSVRVTLNVNGASQNFMKMLEPVAYDKRGNRVVSSTLSFSDTRVKVRAKLLQNKTIPVKTNVTGKPAEGYEYVGADCLPEQIEIAGSEKALADVSEIVIPIDITDLTSTSSALEQEIAVADYLPEDITIPEEYQRISVKVTIEKLIQKKVQIQAGKLQYKNLGDKYMVELYGSDNVIEVTVEGRESILNAMPDTAFSAHVDCSGLKEGIYKLSVKLDAGEDCRLVKTTKVQVIVRRKNQEEATPSPSATQEPVIEEDTEEPTEAPEEEEEQ